MYKTIKVQKTSIKLNKSIEGETIEQKIERIVNNKEPITDGAPLIYTERKDGVLPGYDIRTDRFDVAIEGMDKVTKTHTAQREQRHYPEKFKAKTEEGQGKVGGTESTQATSE